MVGDAVRRTIDANPSLCMPNLMNEDSDNATNDTEYTDGLQIDYPDCPASVDIAVTMTFVYAMFMVGTEHCKHVMLQFIASYFIGQNFVGEILMYAFDKLTVTTRQSASAI